MYVHILIATMIGILFGIITGLAPGIHVNLVSAVLFSIASILLRYTNAIVLACFIISMALTHTFLDFIPSVYVGAPEESTAMAVLPGHKMLLKGKGYNAVKITVIGSFGGLLLTVLLTPVFLTYFDAIYNFLNPHIAIILLLIISYMLLKDRNRKWNILLFALSGGLGLLVLNMPTLKEPLLPMFSGLFGFSGLVESLRQKVNIPPQTIEDIPVSKKTAAKAVLAGTIAGSAAGFFPGLGPAQVAVLSSQFLHNLGDKGFLMLVGSIGTVNFAVSLATLAVLAKARNGAIIVVSQLLPDISQLLLIFIAVLLMSGGIATILTLTTAKYFSRMITKVNYQKLVMGVMAFVLLLVFLFSGWLGLIVLATATTIGMIAPLKGVPRNHLMGCLIVPVLLQLL